MTNPNSDGDRRPIPLRHSAVSRRIAAALAGAGLSANGVSLIGMVLAIAAGIALALTSLFGEAFRLLFLLAALFIPIRGLCNMIDGMIAVELGQAAPTGPLMNEVPDRLSDIALMIGAGYALGGNETLGYLTALAALFIAYLRVAGVSMGTPAFFGGWMAKQPRMFSLAAVCAWLALTPEAWHPSIGGSGLVTFCQSAILIGSVQTVYLRLRQIAAALEARHAPSEEG